MEILEVKDPVTICLELPLTKLNEVPLLVTSGGEPNRVPFAAPEIPLFTDAAVSVIVDPEPGYEFGSSTSYRRISFVLESGE